MPDTQAVTNYLKQQEILGQTRAKAREELEAMIADCQRQLELLGETAKQRKSIVKDGARTITSKEKYCDLCQIAGHNGYAHRKHPEKFTPAELATL